MLVTTCFVTWSAIDRRDRDRCEARPLPGARAERALRDRHRLAARSSSTRPGPQRVMLGDVGQPQPALVVDAETRPRDRGQALRADRLAADLADAVASFVDAQQRSARSPRACAGRPPRGPRRARGRTSRSPCRPDGCRRRGPPSSPSSSSTLPASLLQERRLRRAGRSRSASRSFSELARCRCSSLESFPAPLARVRRRSISSWSMPANATILSRDACPETIATSRRAQREGVREQPDDGRVRLAVLGRRATRTFQAAPWRPTIPGAGGAGRDPQLGGESSHRERSSNPS